MLQQLQAHPQLSQVPFLLYHDQQPSPATRTTVVMKPLRQQTLELVLQTLAPPTNGGPVLIVDDDSQVRDVYARIVGASNGGPITLAAGDAAAIVMLERVTPRLVILDLMMPDMDGFAVLNYLRSSTPRRQCQLLS